MDVHYEKRSERFIKLLRFVLWPLLKTIFDLKIEGLENVPISGPLLFISNHNVGALIESHSSLFILQDKVPTSLIYGFTHPSIFKVPGIKHYFEWIGAVPATYEVAEDVFKKGNSLMIFPGGNRQALRSIWHFKRNDFRWSHGWAKIARDNQIPIVPITFKGSHFVNPIFLSGEWVSKLLILPWILGLKLTSISLGQIIAALGVFFAAKGHIPIFANLILVYFTFIFTPLLLIIPFPISMKIHPVIMPADFNDQKSLENKMAEIMQSIYS